MEEGQTMATTGTLVTVTRGVRGGLTYGRVVVIYFEYNFVSSFKGYLLDSFAHFAITKKCYFHLFDY